jgi:rhodanese-related sulfurtransferase
MAVPGVVGLSPAALEELLASGSITLVDVRERVEHWLGSIAGSRLAPLSSLPVEELAAEAERLVLYCRSGNRSAAAAARISARAGVAIRHLEGGVQAWTGSGRALTRFGAGDPGEA